MMDDMISREAAVMGGEELTDAELIEEIRKAPLVLKPNVDAAPVVHARWKSVKAGASNNYPFWDSKCSECGYTTAMTQTGWLYCPHCGAKMDGKRRESE